MTMRLLVLGSTGFLGRELTEHLRSSGHAVVRHGFTGEADSTVDLRSPKETMALIGDANPAVVINLVALTDVDRCERDPEAARALNTLVVTNVVDGIIAADSGAHLIQISTDQVYSGLGPHGEDGAQPINEYARTKLAGEREAMRVPATVLRTNFVGRSRVAGRSGLSDWIVDSIKSGRRVTVFDDVHFSPLSTDSVCTCVSRVVKDRKSGVYNLGSREGLSKAEFAFRLCRSLGLETDLLTRGSVASASFLAARPSDMRMKVVKFETDFSLQMPATSDEINKVGAHYGFQA